MLQAVQEALKGDSIDSIKSATDALQQELMAMGQAVYAQPQAGGPRTAAPSPAPTAARSQAASLTIPTSWTLSSPTAARSKAGLRVRL